MKIKHKTTGLKLESFLIEAHSRLGYSGAPVFVWPTVPRLGSSAGREVENNFVVHGPSRLLGVDNGHTDEYVKVVTDDADLTQAGKLIAPTNIGMMVVAPAWKILELLHGDEAVKQRNEAEQEWGRQKPEQRRAGEVDVTLDALEGLGETSIHPTTRCGAHSG